MLQVNKKRNLSVIIVGIAAFVGSLAFAHVADAASLYTYPINSSVSAGNIVTVRVLVSTDGRAINNAEGTIQFPTDMLQVMSVSKSSSIFSLWVEEPQFSNAAGTVVFNGGVPNPGYTGQNGEVLSVTFMAKKAGQASITFADPAVRENDGLGTDILTGTQPGSVQISSVVQTENAAPTVKSESLPPKPVIISATNPDQKIWYPRNKASFSWVVPDGVIAIQTQLSKSADSVPNVSHDGSVSEITLNDMADGAFYFHLRYKNSSGWGPVAHYKVQIDTTAPQKFAVDVLKSGVRNTVALDAIDKASGIDFYSITIDDQPAVRVKEDALEDGVYTLPVQVQGDHNLTVLAYDKAGNHTEASAPFTSPEIVAPSIVATSDHVLNSDRAEIKGTTKYPESNILVFVDSGNGDIAKYHATTSKDGSFSIVTNGLKYSGVSKIWAQLVLGNSMEGPLSEVLNILVDDTPFIKATNTITYTLSSLVMALVALFLLLSSLYLGWHKFFGLRKKLARETDSTIEDIHRAMILFKEELGDQLSVLEKIKEDRVLNKKEEKVFRELQNNVDNIDEFIEKKLKKINKA